MCLNAIYITHLPPISLPAHFCGSPYYIYWATKETLRLYIHFLFETKISENIFLIQYEHFNV